MNMQLFALFLRNGVEDRCRSPPREMSDVCFSEMDTNLQMGSVLLCVFFCGSIYARTFVKIVYQESRRADDSITRSSALLNRPINSV